ncbi:MAG: aspartate dehydrogenase [Lachnospiraceae bacterium]|nr:aspartate dehydrogenase [Lachnospiraceae bacterium]MBR1523087.1 aspartate dehydrogenase [Lachnospiraceae bacterium]
MIFCGKKNKKADKYDPDKQEPMIRASICNGEQVAGFRDIKTGRFEEILFVRDPSDLEAFKKEYGIRGEIRKEY